MAIWSAKNIVRIGAPGDTITVEFAKTDVVTTALPFTIDDRDAGSVA